MRASLARSVLGTSKRRNCFQSRAIIHLNHGKTRKCGIGVEWCRMESINSPEQPDWSNRTQSSGEGVLKCRLPQKGSKVLGVPIGQIEFVGDFLEGNRGEQLPLFPPIPWVENPQQTSSSGHLPLLTKLKSSQRLPSQQEAWTVGRKRRQHQLRSQQGRQVQTNERSGLCHLGRYGSHFYCVQGCPKASKKTRRT